MAMFDLKDSEDIKLNECHTDGTSLVKGENLKRLDVTNSSAIAQRESPKPRILRLLATNMVVLGLAIAAGLIVAYLAWRFGWTK